MNIHAEMDPRIRSATLHFSTKRSSFPLFEVIFETSISRKYNCECQNDLPDWFRRDLLIADSCVSGPKHLRTAKLPADESNHLKKASQKNSYSEHKF
jgi:hypothetical protein